jgi:hypothetical protein
MGLNLRERSSGEKKGRLTITKRGPGQVRKLLYPEFEDFCRPGGSHQNDSAGLAAREARKA